MRLILSTLLMVALTCGAFAAPKLPESLQNLTELVKDEEALVNTARVYHRQQLELNEMDRASITGYREGDLSKMELMLMEKIKKRNDSIKTVWEYVLSFYPRNPKAMTYFGEYWYDTGGNQMAGIKYWKEALMIDDELDLVHNNLGLHYTHYGELMKGHTHYQKALKLDHENPDFLFNLAQLYLTRYPEIAKELNIDEKDVFLRALKFSKDAVFFSPNDFEIQKDYATNFYAGEKLGAEVDWSEAAAAWQATFELAKKPIESFFAKLNEGRCWIYADKKTEAIEALKVAQSIDPQSRMVNEKLMELIGSKPVTPQNSVCVDNNLGREKAR